MTTAPDLPVEIPPPAYAVAAVPAQAEADRPLLALVPDLAPDAAGDVIADFDDALRQATPRLQRYATRRLLDPHEAEEVVQEAMLRAFQHRESLHTQDDLMAWLTVVTGRLVIDRLRVRGRLTPVAELPAGSRTGRDTADVVVARDEARIALDALEAMPPRQAAVLWAREVDGLSYDEISERYALSEPTVRSLLHRARRTLRREYAQRGGTLPSLGLVALAPWLHGLRVAAKARDLARRTAGAAAVSATGLAIATIAPLWSHPAQAPTLPTRPPMTVKAEAHRADTSRATTPVRHVSRPVTSRAAARPATQAPAAAHYRPMPLPVTHACAGGGGLNCNGPASVLYLTLPVSAIGVSVDDVPCTSLPTTAVTHCEPSDRKN